MIAAPNLLKDLGRIIFWYPVRWLVLLSPFPLVYWAGALLGQLDYLISGRGRVRRMTANLGRALGCSRQQAEQIVRTNLVNHSRNVLEFIKYPGLGYKQLSSLVMFQGLDYLEEGLKNNQGVLLVTAHFGAKQLLQIALGQRGYTVSQVHYHMQRSELTLVQKHVSQRFRKQVEERLPVTFIPANGFQRKALLALRNNGVLIVAGDGSGLVSLIDKSYRPFDFLGSRMLFPTGAGAMAKRTGAVLLPVFVVREGVQHRIVFEPPIPVDDPLQMVESYVRVLERYVKHYPHLWEFWEEFSEGHLLVPSDQEASPGEAR